MGRVFNGKSVAIIATEACCGVVISTIAEIIALQTVVIEEGAGEDLTPSPSPRGEGRENPFPFLQV